MNWLTKLFSWTRNNSRSSRRAKQSKAVSRSRFALNMDLLEDRILMTTITWNISGSGSWGTASNWMPAQIPGANDIAIINTASAATITIAAGEQVQSLTTASTDTLSITSGGLTVTSGTSALSGPLNMTGGSLTATGTGVNLTVSNSSTTVSQADLHASAGEPPSACRIW